MTAIDRYIAIAICQAQIASDAGKGKRNIALSNQHHRGAVRYGYRVKTDHICRAIRTIRTSPRGMFNYYCHREGDQNNCDSIIAYFEFTINGHRHQVSFHTPYDRAPKELKGYVNSGRKTEWDRCVGGSVNGCCALIDTFGL